MNIINYFIIGTLFTLGVDIVSGLVNGDRFNTLERIVCIIIWPVTMVVFTYSFLKEFIKKK
jgi:hypothetical protein